MLSSGYRWTFDALLFKAWLSWFGKMSTNLVASQRFTWVHVQSNFAVNTWRWIKVSSKALGSLCWTQTLIFIFLNVPRDGPAMWPQWPWLEVSYVLTWGMEATEPQASIRVLHIFLHVFNWFSLEESSLEENKQSQHSTSLSHSMFALKMCSIGCAEVS